MRGEELIFRYFPTLSSLQREQFAALQTLYSEWNERINVVSRKDIDNLYERHVLHSLAIAMCGKIKAGDSVLDVGCGGGFPSVPLAILLPDVSFTAIDSIGKKIKVVDGVSSALGLTNLTTINCRVESLTSRYDWVVSRAVAQLGEFLGFVRGRYDKGVLYLKGGNLDAEISAVGGVDGIYDVGDWFSGEFFESKRLLFLEKGVKIFVE